MRRITKATIAAVVIGGCVLGSTIGAAKLWSFDSKPGQAANAPSDWPANSGVARDPSLPTLVLLMHPHCACSRATLDELSRLMTECRGQVRTTVLLVRPPGAPAGWEKTDLWSSAASIPGVTVLADDQGRESRRFGAFTSGQALLYDAKGRLIFAGGITESRGHSGDNAGESAIESLVTGEAKAPAKFVPTTPVYGCSLFDSPAAGGTVEKEGCKVCPR